MPIDKTVAALTPEQRIKELETQLAQTQEKARLFEAVLEVLKPGLAATLASAAKRITKHSSAWCSAASEPRR